MTSMPEEVREKFLAKTRYAVLTTLAGDGAPISVPVWFDWDGRAVHIFTGLDSPKVC
jgi:nitroimidazol reductase NimA-like FMN-containing flavoprotein (pyridoxamine 5'-phosphate oxidase superfamily)